MIYKQASGRTEAGCITLGWKFELLNKSSGALSGEIQVDPKEVYKGELLDHDKRHAIVEGDKRFDSGVAEFILIANDGTEFITPEQVLEQMIEIDEYVKDHPKIYFACKALNYRTLNQPPKWDGDRPLSVYVDWYVKDGNLDYNLVFDSPLSVKGNSVGNNLINCLHQLGVKNTDNLNSSNVANCKICN